MVLDPQEDNFDTLYSTAAVSGELKVARATIIHLKNRMGLRPKNIIVKGCKHCYFNEEEKEILKKYFELPVDKRHEYETHIREQNVKDELKEHILVTDERCLNFNYWPEIIPKCFEDIV